MKEAEDGHKKQTKAPGEVHSAAMTCASPTPTLIKIYTPIFNRSPFGILFTQSPLKIKSVRCNSKLFLFCHRRRIRGKVINKRKKDFFFFEQCTFIFQEAIAQCTENFNKTEINQYRDDAIVVYKVERWYGQHYSNQVKQYVK